MKSLGYQMVPSILRWNIVGDSEGDKMKPKLKKLSDCACQSSEEDPQHSSVLVQQEKINIKRSSVTRSQSKR